jgi:membrane-associated phospholipid phosphatase
MFLRANNTLKWNWILAGAGATLALVVLGVSGFDLAFYRYLHQFDGPVWHVIGDFFGARIWLFVSFPMFLIATCLKRKYEKAEDAPIPKSKDGFYRRVLPFIRHFKTNLKRLIVWLDFNKAGGGSLFGIVSRVSFLVLCAVILNSILVGPLKVIFGRMRPVFFETLGEYGFVPFTWEWAFNSMPSGHAAASFAGLATIGMFFPKIKGITWALALLVGISRICVGVHWPADVLVGALIGMLSADAIRSWVYQIK